MERLYEIDIFARKTINGKEIDKEIKLISGAKKKHIDACLSRIMNRLHTLGYETYILGFGDCNHFDIWGFRDDFVVNIYISKSMAA